MLKNLETNETGDISLVTLTPSDPLLCIPPLFDVERITWV